jgi:uncharacterized iron-regulated membrane protein
VTPTGTPLAASSQVAAVAGAYPDRDIVTLSAGLAAEQSARFSLVPRHAADTLGGGHDASSLITVFVDPYSGRVLGELAENHTLYAWAKMFHGTLLLGIAGDYVIEIAASLGVLLIVTGLFLWWPRKSPAVQDTSTLSTGGARRTPWRRLHATLGIWSAPLLLFFLLSGLAWTPFWGGELVQAWNSLPGETLATPTVEETHATLDHGVHSTVPWPVEQTPLPAAGAAHDTPGIISGSRPISVDDVIRYADTAGFVKYRVHFPRDQHGVWTLASTTISGDTRVLDGDRIVHLDAGTGNVLAEIRFADYPLLGKLMAASIPLHQADVGGINLVVNLLLCVAVIGLCAAALGAWWARRPGGVRRLVPPPLPRDHRAWHAAVALMLVVSLIFPLAALTIAVVLTVDFFLLRRIPALQPLFD